MDKACEFFSKYESKDLKSLENSQEFNNDFKSFIIDLNDELNNSEIEEELKNESEKDKDDYKDEIDELYKCRDNVKCIIDNKYDLKNPKVTESMKEMVIFFKKVNENMNELNKSMSNLNNTLDNASKTLQVHNSIKTIYDILKNKTIFNITADNTSTINKEVKTLNTYLASLPFQDVDYVVKKLLDRSINFKNELINSLKNCEGKFDEDVKKMSSQLLVANIIEILVEVKKFEKIS